MICYIPSLAAILALCMCWWNVRLYYITVLSSTQNHTVLYRYSSDCLTIQTSSYQYRYTFDKNKTLSRQSYLWHENPIPGKDGIYIETGPWSPHRCRHKGGHFSNNVFRGILLNKYLPFYQNMNDLFLWSEWWWVNIGWRWCRQATRHDSNQFWLRFLTPYSVTKPQWFNNCQV